MPDDSALMDFGSFLRTNRSLTSLRIAYSTFEIEEEDQEDEQSLLSPDEVSASQQRFVSSMVEIMSGLSANTTLEPLSLTGPLDVPDVCRLLEALQPNMTLSNFDVPSLQDASMTEEETEALRRVFQGIYSVEEAEFLECLPEIDIYLRLN